MSDTTTERPRTAPSTVPAVATERAVFERDGFVVIPGLFDEQDIARISAWTDELEQRPDVPGRAMKYFEPSLLRPPIKRYSAAAARVKRVAASSSV